MNFTSFRSVIITGFLSNIFVGSFERDSSPHSRRFPLPNLRRSRRSRLCCRTFFRAVPDRRFLPCHLFPQRNRQERIGGLAGGLTNRECRAWEPSPVKILRRAS